MTPSHEQASLTKHAYKPTDTPISSPIPVPVRDSFVRDLVAGGMSGIIAKTIGAPADRVKLLIQTQSINTNLLVKYRNPIDCVVRVYKDQGLASFWRGNLANVYRYFPSQAMNFAFKDKYKDFFGKLFVGNPSAGRSGVGSIIGLNDQYSRMMVNLLSGGLAGATALCVSYPFDVARTRLAVDVGSDRSTKSTATGATTTTNTTTTNNSSTGNTSRQYSGTFQCLRSTYQLEGIRGIYSGFGVSLGGVILFRALYLGGWDIVKDYYDIEQASFFTRFVAAQAVTTAVGTFCFPIDSVKRRLMVQRKLLPVEDTLTSSSPSMSSSGSGINGYSSSSGSGNGSSGSSGIKEAPKNQVKNHTTHATLNQPNIKAHVPYKNGLDCATRIIREEGVKGLFAGLSVNLVRGFTGAVLLVAYDDLKKRL